MTLRGTQPRKMWGEGASAHEGLLGKMKDDRCHLQNSVILEGQMVVLVAEIHKCGACH